MNRSLNILILSCGTRNKIVQYFKLELEGKGQVFATDCSEFAPALYEADQHFIVSNINEPGYLDEILQICLNNKISCVLSLIDPELSLIAKNKNAFLAIGTTPIVSEYDLVELCFDKYNFNQKLLREGFNAVRSYIDKDEFYQDVEKSKIDYPVFVKPVRGSASVNISMASSKDEIEFFFNKYDDLMIQEFMSGSELGADVYIDMISNEPVAIFVKEKLKMRAGETDKAVSIKDDDLFALIVSFVSSFGFQGVIDIDIFKQNNKYYISEVNPRFGGGYPHAYECGQNIPRMIIRNLEGHQNNSVIGDYESDVFMMKYSSVSIIQNGTEIFGEQS